MRIKASLNCRYDELCFISFEMNSSTIDLSCSLSPQVPATPGRHTHTHVVYDGFTHIHDTHTRHTLTLRIWGGEGGRLAHAFVYSLSTVNTNELFLSSFIIILTPHAAVQGFARHELETEEEFISCGDWRGKRNSRLLPPFRRFDRAADWRAWPVRKGERGGGGE